jgi:hypothetical protein
MAVLCHVEDMAMAMSAGGSSQPQFIDQRYADGRHHAGVADHLHGGHATAAIRRLCHYARRARIQIEDANITKDTAVVIAIPNDGQFYIGRDLIQGKDRLIRGNQNSYGPAQAE